MRSAASASETPTPAAGPLTAAITGIGAVSTARTRAAALFIVSSGLGVSPPGSLIDWRSAPVVNAPPSPASTMTRVSGSAPCSVISSTNAVTVA